MKNVTARVQANPILTFITSLQSELAVTQSWALASFSLPCSNFFYLPSTLAALDYFEYTPLRRLRVKAAAGLRVSFQSTHLNLQKNTVPLH